MSSKLPALFGAEDDIAQCGAVNLTRRSNSLSDTQTADATSADATSSTATSTDTATATDARDDWEAKYQGQLKVNRDLEDKLKDAAGVARKKLEAEYADKLKKELELKDKPAEEQALEAARAEARAEAIKAANARILKSELKALATGKLADPSDAALYLPLDDFTVSDDGAVDSDALTAAIEALLEKKPHLAAQKQTRFDGGADQGAKGKETVATQLTKDELKDMSPEAIVKAQAEGRLKDLLGAS